MSHIIDKNHTLKDISCIKQDLDHLFVIKKLPNQEWFTCKICTLNKNNYIHFKYSYYQSCSGWTFIICHRNMKRSVAVDLLLKNWYLGCLQMGKDSDDLIEERHCYFMCLSTIAHVYTFRFNNRSQSLGQIGNV